MFTTNSANRFSIVGDSRAIHGIGHQIDGGLSCADAFRVQGMDWGTNLAPVLTTLPDGSHVNVETHRVHMRADNGSVLGVVTDGYRPIENMDMARFVDGLAGLDAAVSVEIVGELNGGRRMFVLVKLPQTIQVGSDITEPFVLISNGHGGAASFQVRGTSHRYACANMLSMTKRESMAGAAFKHTGDIDSKLKAAKRLLGLAQQEAEQFRKQVIHLANTDLSAGQVRDFMGLAYDQTFGAIPSSADAETKAKLEAKRADTLNAWLANMDDARQQVAGIQGTAWAAMNAITQHHQHERGRYGAHSDARQHSNLFGAAGRDSRKAFDLALATFAG